MRKDLCEELEDGETDNGTEQVGTEGPSGLQSEVQVRGVDQSTANGAHEHCTNRHNSFALIWEIVERHERVELFDLAVVLVELVLFHLAHVGRALLGDLGFFVVAISGDRRLAEDILLLGEGRNLRVDVALRDTRQCALRPAGELGRSPSCPRDG